LQQYHERLLGWGQAQRWQLDGQEIRGILESIDLQGKICVLDASGQQCYAPGEVGWLGMEPS
jgi:biotin-(acetyl-CoA carboxylase) ligase